jgi:hypothetical protein
MSSQSRTELAAQQCLPEKQNVHDHEPRDHPRQGLFRNRPNEKPPAVPGALESLKALHPIGARAHRMQHDGAFNEAAGPATQLST